MFHFPLEYPVSKGASLQNAGLSQRKLLHNSHGGDLQHLITLYCERLTSLRAIGHSVLSFVAPLP